MNIGNYTIKFHIRYQGMQRTIVHRRSTSYSHGSVFDMV